MKIIIVKPPLQQSSVNLLKPWVGNTDKVYTNSDLLVKLRPNTFKVDEPTPEQLAQANQTHELVFVYPNLEQLKRHVHQLSKLTGDKRVVVDGRKVNVEDYVPKIPEDIECLKTPNGSTLRYYQQQLVDFILERKRVGLFVDMGLGKTLTTLATIDKLFKDGELSPTKPVLVIAPKMVALDTWAREAEKWGYDIDVLINIGLSPKKRQILLKQAKSVTKPTILTTNPEQLANLVTEFEYDPFELVVVDELSMFKSPTSQRFHNLRMLTDNLRYFIGLTGTPAPNSLLDIWSQLVVVNPKVRYDLGHTFLKYRSHFFLPDIVNPRNGIVFSWKLVPGAEEAIYEKIEPYVISMKGASLVDIPDVTYTEQYVSMDKKSREIYDRFDIEIRKALKIEDKAIEVYTGENDVRIANTAILKSKLLQIATGAVYDEGSRTRAYTVFHNKKLEKLKEILSVSTSPVLVFYNFVSDVKRIKEVVPNAVVLNTQDKNVNNVIQKWNQGKIPVLLANPKSTGHGLNLQDGGHIIVWFSLTWNNEIYRQANKRLHRPGQKHPVQIIHIITRNTADEEILPRLNSKEEGQQTLLSVLEVEQ